MCFCADSSDQLHLASLLTNTTSGMDSMGMEEEDDCPELVPIDTPPGVPAEQIPVTIITGYLGEKICITHSVNELIKEIMVSDVCESILTTTKSCSGPRPG